MPAALCALPLNPREYAASHRTFWPTGALTLAEWLTDAPPRIVDPDAPGDNIDRIATQVNIGWRPSSHLVQWTTRGGRIVRTWCGQVEPRSAVIWTTRPAECGTCLAVQAHRAAA
jgi:hypothetical protein